MWAKYLWRAWHPEQRMRSGEQAQNVRQRYSPGDDPRCGAVHGCNTSRQPEHAYFRYVVGVAAGGKRREYGS